MALTGRAALVALVGVLAVFVQPWHGRTLLVVEGCLAAAIVADLALAGSVRSLYVTRDGDTARRLDEPARLTLTVVNRGRRRVRATVRDAWAPSIRVSPHRHRVDVPAGERRRLVSTLQPTRRAEFAAANVTVRSVGPLGLAARQGNHAAPWRLRVLPAFPSRKYLPEKLARLRLLDGRTAARVRGQGTEFDSLRDYVEGDDARSVDWRATARRGSVVVRTWRPERDRRIVLVLDTGRTSAARLGDGTRLDAALDAALLLGTLAARAGDRVDVLAFDNRPRLASRAGKTESPLASLLLATAALQPRLVETDAQRLVGDVLQRTTQRALVVVFTSIEEAAGAALADLVPALTARHNVIVAAVTDPVVVRLTDERGDADAVYAAAAAERTLATHDRVAARLRRAGAWVVEGAPDHFASRVADTYLELKAAGRL
jgi:uncharacterized protein (DUF58 family)